MRKTILVAAAAFLLASFSPVDTYVYICNGPQSKRYHYTKNCQGLRNCSTDVERVTLKVAEDKGRTLCGWED